MTLIELKLLQKVLSHTNYNHYDWIEAKRIVAREIKEREDAGKD